MSNIESFFQAHQYAVVGASSQRQKYGNIVFRALRDAGFDVTPVNPNSAMVEGQVAYARLAEIPILPQALSVVTPPAITDQIITQAIELGVQSIWMQPGAENPAASQRARDAGLNVIDDGQCILVLLAQRRSTQ